MKKDVTTLTMKQLKRYEIITQAIAGFISVAEAASVLGLSTRQIKRLKKEVAQNGASALVHKNSLIRPPCALPEDVIQNILKIRKQEGYCDSNFRHFNELLNDNFKIKISYSTLYNLLSKQGIKSPKTRRRFKPHRRRKRRPQAGLLLQVDATSFVWFGGRARYTLHGAIDDATGQITGLYLCKNECMYGYFQMLRRTISNYGIPAGIYADRHTIFRSPNADKITVEEQLKGVTANDTQFGRCLKELGIQLIAARSPQAKGRIERLWQTLQSRLTVEFKINNISTIDDANEFLKSYIYKFNSEFAVEPSDSQNAFRKIPAGLNIDYCLCIKEQRSLDNGGVFSYHNKSFKLLEAPYSDKVPPKAKVTVLLSPDFGIKIQYRSFVFDVVRFIPHKRKQPTQQHKPIVSRPAPDSHYFKYGQALFPKLVFTETDQEILSMLQKIFLGKYA